MLGMYGLAGRAYGLEIWLERFVRAMELLADVRTAG